MSLETEVPEHRYVVSVLDRVRNLLYDSEVLIGEHDEVSYSWHHGYERLRIDHRDGGSYDYEGQFHPGNGACRGNPCDFCGMVWPE